MTKDTDETARPKWEAGPSVADQVADAILSRTQPASGILLSSSPEAINLYVMPLAVLQRMAKFWLMRAEMVEAIQIGADEMMGVPGAGRREDFF